MDVPPLLAHLAADAAAVHAAAVADPNAPVPTCPGWDRHRLVGHLCIAYGTVLAQLDAGPGAARGFDDAERPPKGAARFDFFQRQATAVAAALAAVDPASTWPTWVGPRPAAFFSRRMAHETAVHRVDVAGGTVEPDFAADGIDELLSLLAPLVDPGAVAAQQGTVHLHATDPGVEGGEWLVALGPDGITHRKEHAKGDVAVRAPAADLYLWLWGRRDLGEGFEVFGDEDLARRLREVLTR